MFNTLFLEKGLDISIDKLTPLIRADLLDFEARCSFESGYEGFYSLHCIVLVFDEFFPAFSSVIINDDKGIVVALDGDIKRAL